MPFRILRIASCNSGKTCPALADTGHDTHFVVGAVRAVIGLEQGHGAVEVPGDLLGMPPGPVIVIGFRVTDPGVLSKLPIGPGEAAVEVADLGREVTWCLTTAS